MTLSELLAAFDPELPLEQARTIPSSWYVDPQLFAVERRHVFSGWQAVGRTDQLERPGSFLTADLAGEPVLVLRGEDGELRAFFNVCRHRAAPLLTQPQGTVSKLRCRYHGWTYDLAGRLRGTPEFDGVADFCREENGLVPMPVATWGPLVWVQPHPGPADQPLDAFLAPLTERTRGLGLDKLRFVERRTYDLACNWKVYVDNYLDGGYHINTVHPGLAGVLDYSQYRSDLYENASVQLSPLKPDDGSVGQVRTGSHAYYWWVFPNFMLNLYAGVMDTNLVLPLAVDRCRVIFDFYFADTEGEAARQFIANSVKVAHEVQLEDQGICEEVQRGLGSRAFDVGRFSVKREATGYHFHRLLANRLRQALGQSLLRPCERSEFSSLTRQS